MKKFTFPKQISDLVAMLPVEEQGLVYSALFAFVFNNEDRSATMTGLALAIYNLSVLAVKPQLARARYRARKKAEAEAQKVAAEAARDAGLPAATTAAAPAEAAPEAAEVVERVGKYTNFRPDIPGERPHPKRYFCYDERDGDRVLNRRVPFRILPRVLSQEACARGWGERV